MSFGEGGGVWGSPGGFVIGVGKKSSAAYVCVSKVIESLAAWRHYKPKTKNQGIHLDPFKD